MILPDAVIANADWPKRTKDVSVYLDDVQNDKSKNLLVPIGKALNYKSHGGICKPGQRADLTGCIPVDHTHGGAHDAPKQESAIANVVASDDDKKVIQKIGYSSDELAKLGGGLSGSEVTVQGAYIDSWGGHNISLKIDHPEYKARSTVFDNSISLDSIEAKPDARPGLALRFVQSVVDAATKAGKQDVTGLLSRQNGVTNGYYTFAVLGFDHKLPGFREGRYIDQEARRAFPGAERISDLMKTPEGRKWWKENGVSFDGTFDLAPDSVSRELLANYQKEKGASQQSPEQAKDDWKKNGVRSQSFKNWFGDWENDPANASKVVDEQGKPLVVYHGSPSKSEYENNRNMRDGSDDEYPDFQEFDTERQGSSDSGWLGRGTYFTPDTSYAEEFGDKIYPVYLSIKKPFIVVDDHSNSVANNFRFLQSIQQLDGLPDEYKLDLRVPDDETFEDFRGDKVTKYHRMQKAKDGTYYLLSSYRKGENGGIVEGKGSSPEEAVFAYRYKNNKMANGFLLHIVTEMGSRTFSDLLKRNGYDGVISKDDGNSMSEIVAFYPHQIKSKHNMGTFDASSNNITKSLKKDCDCDDCQEGKECPCGNKAMSWLNTNSGGALVGAAYKPKQGDKVSVIDDKGHVWVKSGVVTFADEFNSEVIGDGLASGMFPNQFIQKTTKHKFSSTQFDLSEAGYNRTQGSPIPLLQKIQDLIPDAELAEDGKEDNFHLTVKYGLHTSDANEVKDVLKQWLKLRSDQDGFLSCKAVLKEVSLFPAQEPTMQRGGKDFDVVKVDVESDDLHELNQFLADNLAHTDTHPIYHPHITIAYLQSGRGEAYVGASLNDHELLLHRLVFSDQNGEKTVFDFHELWDEMQNGVKSYEAKAIKKGTCTPGHNPKRDHCISNDYYENAKDSRGNSNVDEKIKSTLGKVTESFKSTIDPNATSGEFINMGDCGIWAFGAFKVIPNSKLNEVDCKAGSHAFLQIGNRFYDAENPEGVDDWRKLNYLQRSKPTGPRKITNESAFRHNWLKGMEKDVAAFLEHLSKNVSVPKVLKSPFKKKSYEVKLHGVGREQRQFEFFINLRKILNERGGRITANELARVSNIDVDRLKTDRFLREMGFAYLPTPSTEGGTFIMTRKSMEAATKSTGVPDDSDEPDYGPIRGRTSIRKGDVIYEIEKDITPDDPNYIYYVAEQKKKEKLRQSHAKGLDAYASKAIAQPAVSSPQQPKQSVQGQPCKRGQSAARSGCVPKSANKQTQSSRGQPCKRGQSAARSGCIPKAKPQPRQPKGAQPSNANGTNTAAQTPQSTSPKNQPQQQATTKQTNQGNDNDFVDVSGDLYSLEELQSIAANNNMVSGHDVKVDPETGNLQFDPSKVKEVEKPTEDEVFSADLDDDYLMDDSDFVDDVDDVEPYQSEQPKQQSTSNDNSAKPMRDASNILDKIQIRFGQSPEQVQTHLKSLTKDTRKKGGTLGEYVANAFTENAILEDAIFDLDMDKNAALERLGSIVKGDLKKAIKGLAGVSEYDLDMVTSISVYGDSEFQKVAVQDDWPFAQVDGLSAYCNLKTGAMVMREKNKSDVYTHELAHAIHGAYGENSAFDDILQEVYTSTNRMRDMDQDKVFDFVMNSDDPNYDTPDEFQGIEFPSDYGMTDYHEFFAEHFRLYHAAVAESRKSGDKNAINRHRKKFPKMSRLIDSHYTVALLGRNEGQNKENRNTRTPPKVKPSPFKTKSIAAFLGGKSFDTAANKLQGYVDDLSDDEMDGIEVYVENGGGKAIIDIMDWGEESVGRKIGAFAESLGLKAEYQNEGGKPNQSQFLRIKSIDACLGWKDITAGGVKPNAPQKQNVQGKPCPMGYNAERDGCIPTNNQQAQQENKPQETTQQPQAQQQSEPDKPQQPTNTSKQATIEGVPADKAKTISREQAKDALKWKDGMTFVEGSNVPNKRLPDGTRPELNEFQKGAFQKYSRYNDVALNKRLRNQSWEKDTPYGEGFFDEMHAQMQSAFDAAPVLSKPVKCVRGMNLPDDVLQKLVSNIENAKANNGTVSFDGYISTSMPSGLLYNLGLSTGIHGPFKGNVSLSINAVHGIDMKPYSQLSGEEEFLLNHQSQFKVKSIKKTNKGYAIELDQLPPVRDGKKMLPYVLVKAMAEDAPDPDKVIGYYERHPEAVAKWIDTDASHIKFKVDPTIKEPHDSPVKKDPFNLHIDEVLNHKSMEMKAATAADMGSKFKFPTVQDAGRWLADKWRSLEDRYGRRGALAVAISSIATFPIPGNITVIVGIAEALRKLSGYSSSKSIDSAEVYAKAQGTCKQGERSDLTGCTPASDDPKQAHQSHEDDAPKYQAEITDYESPANPKPKKEEVSPAKLRAAKKKEEKQRTAQAMEDWKNNGVKSQAFKNWFGDWENNPEFASKVVGDDGKPKVVYHGSKRSERIDESGKFDPKRATSGPMGYFTDDPDIASNYATGKEDTSIEKPSDYADWFLVKVKGARKPVNIDRAWYSLDWETREKLRKTLPQVGYKNEEDYSEGFALSEDGGVVSSDTWDYEIKQARGNVFAAAKEIWLNGGVLFDREDEFLQVLETAGFKDAIYNDPWQTRSGVYAIYLNIRRPLDTTDIPSNVIDDIKQAAKRKRGKPMGEGADMWDKRHQSGAMFVQRLTEDLENGTTYAWTSIPDWVTDVLKSYGYDGIKDKGGKYHPDQTHAVWIPFYPQQIKSAIGNQGTFDPNDEHFSKSLLIPIAKALGYKDASGGTCKQGERSDLTGCTPADHHASPKKQSKPKQETHRIDSPASESTTPVKRRAEKGKLVSARREGKGKDAKVILHGGATAPEHIKPSMIPPAWKKVRISLDPDADVLVTGFDAKGRSKTVYHEKYIANQQAAKFAKIQEGLKKFEEMADEIQNDRNNPELKDMAECAWLMQEQATRPGSDADTKGFEHLYGKEISKDNFAIKRDKKGKPSVVLQIEGQNIPMKDDGTKEEIIRRIENNEDLEDSTYWLKSFGATTLEARHVIEKEDGVHLRFQGKESVFHDHRIRNPELAKVLLERKNKAESPTGKLFNVDYNDVSKYVHKLDGGMYTPKDLRTTLATRMAIDAINKVGKNCCKDPEEYKAKVMEVATQVSSVLGNRPQQALESYIAPEVWSTWRNPELEGEE